MSETQTPQDGAPAERKRRWPKVLLIVSLALNLLVIGGVAGAALTFKKGGFGGPRHAAFARAVHDLIGQLPEDRRKATEQLVSEHRAKVRSIRAKMREARRTAVHEFRSESYDEARFKAALESLHDTRSDMHHAMAALMVKLGKALTVEERRAFVRAFMRARFHGRPHGRGPGRDGPPPH